MALPNHSLKGRLYVEKEKPLIMSMGHESRLTYEICLGLAGCMAARSQQRALQRRPAKEMQA